MSTPAVIFITSLFEPALPHVLCLLVSIVLIYKYRKPDANKWMCFLSRSLFLFFFGLFFLKYIQIFIFHSQNSLVLIPGCNGFGCAPATLNFGMIAAVAAIVIVGDFLYWLFDVTLIRYLYRRFLGVETNN